MEKDQYKKLIKSIAAAYQDATEQFIGDSEDLLKLASKTKSGAMQTQISVDDMNQYYADALLKCLKDSNNLINGIAEKFFKNNYKEALAALTEIINNTSVATKAKLKSYGLENDEQVKVDFLTVNYVTKYLKPLVTGKDLINLISQKEKDGVRTRATVAVSALKNIGKLYLQSPADMSGLKRSIVDLDKISKMKSESYCSEKTLLEQARVFFQNRLKDLWDDYASIIVDLDQGYGNNVNKLKKQLSQIYKTVLLMRGKECADDMKDAAEHRLGYSEYLSGKDYDNAVAMEKKLRKKHNIKL